MPIQDNSDYFTVRARQVPPNYSKNDFESVKSELIWKLENWNRGRLDRLQVMLCGKSSVNAAIA